MKNVADTTFSQSKLCTKLQPDSPCKVTQKRKHAALGTVSFLRVDKILVASPFAVAMLPMELRYIDNVNYEDK